MQLKHGSFCPLLKKQCIGLECAWYTKVAGYDTNTGREVEEWQCAVAWMPLLMIENSGQQRQTGAAVESFRNEMVKAQHASHELFANAISSSNQSDKLIDVSPQKPKLVRSKK